MNKSIEEKRDALVDKYVSLSGPAITRFMMSWDFKNGFDSGLTIGLEQAKVLCEALEFYADDVNWNETDPGFSDCIDSTDYNKPHSKFIGYVGGMKARQALKLYKEKIGVE